MEPRKAPKSDPLVKFVFSLNMYLLSVRLILLVGFCSQPNMAISLVALLVNRSLLAYIMRTEVNEIEDEEAVKSVAPALTAHTCHAIVSYGVAAHSS